jgi:hypothetical protein
VITSAVKNLSDVTFSLDEWVIKSEVSVLLTEIPPKIKSAYQCHRLPEDFEKNIVAQLMTMFFGKTEKTITVTSDSRDDDYFSDFSVEEEEEDSSNSEVYEEEDERSW